MDELLKSRRKLQSQTDKLRTIMNGHTTVPITTIAAKVHLEKVIKLKSEADQNYENVTNICGDDEYDTHVKIFETLDDKLTDVQVALLDIISANPTPNSIAPPANTPVEVRLPRLEVPKFNGDLNDWISFKDLFRASVHENAKLSDAQKLIYLKASLVGNASKLLSSLASTDGNYNTAWATLENRYQNERELAFSVSKRLFGQPAMQGESATSLRKLIDTSNECIRSLELLNARVDHWDVIIVYMMLQRVDVATRQFWELSLSDTSLPNLVLFLDFLEQRARALAAGGICKTSVDGKANHGARVMVNHVSAKTECKICTESHPVFRYPTFIGMGISERRDAAKKNGLCFICLMDGHPAAKCRSKYLCKNCKGRHNSLLHQPKEEGQNDQVKQTVQIHAGVVSQFGQGMLATALVKLMDVRNNLQPGRAFLDGGSTSSFITESFARQLGLSRMKTSPNITGIGSCSIGHARGSVSVAVHPYNHSPQNEILVISMLILPTITGNLPQKKHSSSGWKHLRGIQLADPTYNEPGRIDILLGADVFWDILLDGKRMGIPGSPSAYRSKLGWLVAGNMGSASEIVSSYQCDVDLDKRLQTFWELESIPEASAWTQEEKLCEEHFQSTVSRDVSGVYTVSFPFRNQRQNIGASRDIAIRRLNSLERRLRANPEHKIEYTKFMQEYEGLGHMEIVPKNVLMAEQNNGGYYIPHHFVVKDSSTTTKFRVVFDASSKSSSGVSLNEELLIGPTIQDSLVSILMRFRTHVIAYTADIAKMYRQIRINPEQRKFQRICWRENMSDDVKVYQLNTVTYGTASAPFHATRVLKQLALDEVKNLPLASEIAQRDFYVDDLMSGDSTVEEALNSQAQLLELTRRGGMELRKWVSNHPALLASLPEELREVKIPLSIDKDGTVKTLGLHWNAGSDVFTFKVNLPPCVPGRVISKRTLLSEMSKVFDPLGWLSPVTIKVKILYQQIWKTGVGWDEAVPDEIFGQWMVYREQLHAIEKIQIRRCIQPTGTTQTTLHGFCDASEKAYAAVVYSRADQDAGAPLISIIAAKTRVAPSSPVSLPRLELCGGVLLSKLISKVKQSMNMEQAKVFAWTDSTIVLDWIRGHPSRWKTFVANRVTEIHNHLSSEDWGHVDGTMNPADCASRGINPDELSNHPLWWTGPSWMSSVPQAFPKNYSKAVESIDPDYVKERKRDVITVHTTSLESDVSLLYAKSSLTRLKRVTAWILRFLSNCRFNLRANRSDELAVRLRGPLTADEMDKALMTWVKIVQGIEFAQDVSLLMEGEPLRPKSKIRNLNPFLDANGVLRVGGRLMKASIPSDQKMPILLPRRHHLTYLVIRQEHWRTCHGGAQLVINSIQLRFWIPGVKDVVRHQIRRCVTCTRHKAVTMQQFMGNLPEARITPGRPFLTCGVDYAGPFIVRAIPSRSKVTIKAYLALFICYVTRAVHLEVVSAMTTEAFLAALKRFVGRRGLVRDIHCDCGTNFVGAARETKDWMALVNSTTHNQLISEQMSKDGISWHFNPPGAPHFGGLWEAGVKSVKFHLNRVIGSARLTFEELTTAMV